jgi:hypothetical protein
MRRRDLLAFGSAAVVAGSVGSRAQHVTVPVIGWLGTESAGSFEKCGARVPAGIEPERLR